MQKLIRVTDFAIAFVALVVSLICSLHVCSLTVFIHRAGLHVALHCCIDLLIDVEDVAYILRALEASDVDYVKLWWNDHPSFDAPNNYEAQPGDQHSTFKRLSRTHFWSDRPHFCTSEHYTNVVWPKISLEDRCTMEQKIERDSDIQNTWIYGHVRTERHNECGSQSSWNVR